MKKQKSIGNKGFSLVELIIVIAIMAILVGVMAPQLLRYVERTRVSSDTQLADSVRTAVRTAMMDPVVLNDDDATTAIAAFNAGGVVQLTSINSPTGNQFANAVAETLGVTAATLADVADELQSTPVVAGTDMTIEIWSINGNDVGVRITNSNDGSGTGAGHEITIGTPIAPGP